MKGQGRLEAVNLPNWVWSCPKWTLKTTSSGVVAKPYGLQSPPRHHAESLFIFLKLPLLPLIFEAVREC